MQQLCLWFQKRVCKSERLKMYKSPTVNESKTHRSRHESKCL
jgi:hypothetical protein